MNNIEIIEYLEKGLKKKGADDVVIDLSYDTSMQVKFANNKISVNETWDAAEASIFTSFNKKIITSSLKEFDKKAADDIISKIVSFSNKCKPNDEHQGIAKGPFNYNKIEGLYDKKVMGLEDDAIDFVDEAVNKASEIGAKRSAGVLKLSRTKSHLFTSNDVRAEEEGTSAYFSIRCFTDKDASGHSNSISRVLRHFKPLKAAEFAANIAIKAKNPKTINAGKYDVLFEPLPFSCILQHVGEAASIFSVESGLSFLNKLNEKVANDNVTIYDYGNLENGLGSSRFDGEGMPRQKTTIVEDGVLKNYLHNYSTAKRYNVKSTGNAGLIAPDPTNVVMREGDYSKEEMIKEIKKGLYITNTWYTRFTNYNTGEFSTIPRDGIFYIENGEIKYPVKEIRISDNVLNILKNIMTIGKNVEPVSGWEVDVPCFTPHVLVKDVNISKSVE